MIVITEQAKNELRQLLYNKVDWPGARLRLMDRGQGKLGLGVDIESPGDQIVEYKGEKLLIIKPELANSLKEITLDVEETPEGVELIISEKALA